MPSSELVRWSGLAAMLGGALWSIGFNFVGWGEPGTPVYERYEAYNRLLPLALLPSQRESSGCTPYREEVTDHWVRRASLRYS